MKLVKNNMQDFTAFMEVVTVHRYDRIINDSARAVSGLVDTFEISAIVRPMGARLSGEIEMLTTANKGAYALGEIIVITEVKLRDASLKSPDRIVYGDIEYEIVATKSSKGPLPHFQYTCCAKI